MKKTEWISCEVKPTHAGNYEVRFWDFQDVDVGFGSETECYFDGGYWLTQKNGRRLTGSECPGFHKKDEWRGILK